jgi:hypothetical protein
MAEALIAPLSLCAPAAQIRDWAATASPGDSIIYAQGAEPPRDESGFVSARALEQAGVIALFQTKRDGLTYWQARRLPGVPTSAGWTPEARLMAMIAKTGTVRATNQAIADHLGLRNRDRAGALIRKMRSTGVISIRFDSDGRRVIAKAEGK